MQSYDEILTRLTTTLQPYTKDNVAIRDDTMLASDLGLDSGQLMELILEIEEQFDISIPLNVLPGVYNVKDLVVELQKLLEPAQ